MEFETVQIGNAHYAVKNGVMGTRFAARVGDKWGIFLPVLQEPLTKTLEEALTLVASGLDDWYTAAQAADVLVEIGAFDEAPSTSDVCLWARHGLLPGAVKILTKPGRGGQWRIPEAGLVAFAKRRKGR